MQVHTLLTHSTYILVFCYLGLVCVHCTPCFIVTAITINSSIAVIWVRTPRYISSGTKHLTRNLCY